MTNDLVSGAAMLALFLSLGAILLSVGTAMRVNQRWIPPRLTGLQPGEPIPQREIHEAAGDQSTGWLNDSALVIFVKSDCPPCADLMRSLNDRTEDLVGAEIVIIEQGPFDDKTLHRNARFPALWLNDPHGAIQGAFQSSATPHFFVIGGGVVLDSQIGSNIDAIMSALSMVSAPVTSEADARPTIRGPESDSRHVSQRQSARLKEL